MPDAEMNSDLAERFRDSLSLTEENIPISSPLRDNNDIRDYFKLSKKQVSGGVWLQQPEIPSSSEVLREQSGFTNGESLIEIDDHIRPHKAQGAYEDKEDYLKTVYELLREDTVRPLREAIDEVRADPFKDEAEYQNQSIGIYDPVYIKSLVFSPRGLATRVAFSLGRVKKHIR
jgi:helicase required for RNAi-mediated heterochromatin assembly 1